MSMRYLDIRYWAVVITALLALTACERDEFIVDDDIVPNGKPVNVILPFEVLLDDEEEVTTRSLNEREEHYVHDLYVLIFNAEGERVFGKYYAMDEMLNKQDYTGSNWKEGQYSDNQQNNSSTGQIIASAMTGTCFIYGFANLKEDGGNDMDVKGVKEVGKAELTDLVSLLDNVMSVTEMQRVQVDLNVSARSVDRPDILERYRPNLVMSGAFRNKQTNPDPVYAADQQGRVVITQSDLDSQGNIDLTNKGKIYLRRLVSHVTFNLSFDYDIISDFKPTSWKVVNVPVRSYLVDRGIQTEELHSSLAFAESTEHTSMLHVDGKYRFEFYTMENHKNAREVGNATDAPRFWYSLTQVVHNTDEANAIMNYYKNDFGETISSTNGAKLHVVYSDNVDQFKYAKRELQLKTMQGIPLMNVEGDENYWLKYAYEIENKDLSEYQGKLYTYTSKKFVYVEPMATYVEIKGRLRFNTATVAGRKDYEGFRLQNRVAGTYEDFKNGYADVTYTIHLGYVGGGTGANQDPKLKKDGTYISKEEDFNIMRNTRYTYNVQINGVNNIYTSVVAQTDPNTNDLTYRVKKQPGADGYIGVASGEVYNTDAHFNQFVIDLDKSTVNGFTYGISTPFSSFVSTPTLEVAQTHENDPDFQWIHFRYNGIKDSGGNLQAAATGVTDVAELNKVLPYKTSDATYNQSGNTEGKLMDLRQLREFIEAKKETWNTNYGDNYDVFFSTYLDEYYYDTPPGSQSWTPPYWHYFVNKPSRYVTMGLDAFEYEEFGIYGYHVWVDQDGHVVYHNFTTSEDDPDRNKMYYLDNNGNKHFIDGLKIVNEYNSEHPKLKNEVFYYNDVSVGSSQYTGSGLDKRYFCYTTGSISDTKPSAGTPYLRKKTYISYRKLSRDTQSGISYTKLMIVQPSIQTYYSTDASTALGVEHFNETQHPRWFGDANAVDTNPAHFSQDNGWANTAAYISGVNAGSMSNVMSVNWADYVSDEVHPTQNNLMMKLSGRTANDSNRPYNESNSNTDNPYLASAIRLCMNRNRDENGDGKIDEGELKWYLPASNQLEFMNLCHFSLYDPPFNYNDLYKNSELFVNGHLILPEVGDESYQVSYGGRMAAYGFVASDYKRISAEEMSIKSYKWDNSSYAHQAREMRCVRNLGVTNPATETPQEIYTYDPSTNMFTLNNLDSRNIRTAVVESMELPNHTMFSETNRPFYKFKVASNEVKIEGSLGKPIREVLANPCRTYSEGPDDLGTWRVPNIMEIALQLLYDYHTVSANVNYSNSTFFKSNGVYYYSNSCWNFTPHDDVWGRIPGLRSTNDGWRIYMSDPQYSSGNWSDTKAAGTVAVRCVKDVK